MAGESDQNEIFQKVFVYGTLKKGQPNHYLMIDNPEKNGIARFYAQALSVNKYPLVVASHAHIPCMLDVKGQGHVSNNALIRKPKHLCSMKTTRLGRFGFVIQNRSHIVL